LRESEVHLPWRESSGIEEAFDLLIKQHSAGKKSEEVDWAAIRPELDSLIYEGQQRYIADTGRVTIAEEMFHDSYYLLVLEEDKVRLTADTPECQKYVFLVGPDRDSSSLAPPSHMARLLKLADEGADWFKRRTERVRRAINECPALGIDILLFQMSDHSTELRCEADKSGSLLRKLGFTSLDGFLHYLNSTAPPGSPVQHGVHSGRRSSIETHGSESYVVAADLSCNNQTEPNDGTRCIVFHAPEKKYRMWTWRHARSLYSSLASCGPDKQLHKPDEPLLDWIESWSEPKGSGFKAIAHTVVTALTSRYTENCFVHTVLVTIDDPEIWRKWAEKEGVERGNTRPLRCSKSRFIKAGGRESAFIDALQLDTEEGRAYYKIWKERKNTRRSRNGADTRKRQYTSEPMDKLAAGTQDPKNDSASRHERGGGVSMSPGSWKVFLECVVSNRYSEK
jgi:hypothetical protein